MKKNLKKLRKNFNFKYALLFLAIATFGIYHGYFKLPIPISQYASTIVVTVAAFLVGGFAFYKDQWS